MGGCRRCFMRVSGIQILVGTQASEILNLGRFRRSPPPCFLRRLNHGGGQTPSTHLMAATIRCVKPNNFAGDAHFSKELPYGNPTFKSVLDSCPIALHGDSSRDLIGVERIGVGLRQTRKYCRGHCSIAALAGAPLNSCRTKFVRVHDDFVHLDHSADRRQVAL